MNDEQSIIDSILSRGVANIYPSPEFLAAKLRKGEKITLYLGVDPTGPTLHLGHVIPLRKLAQFQKMGHKIILLMGDFTAMIGDPNDKGDDRIALTLNQVLANLKNYKKQASSMISFSGKNKAEFKYNSKWLGKMKFSDVLSLASNMTVQQMLERDMFEKRIEEGKPIYIHEFMYPLMQGYDSVAMGVDGEVGGNDQTFNMLAGRTLMKTLQNKEKFVITMKLLEDSTGKKMGKTEGNMIALSDGPEEMFGKVMSWSDGMIIPGFELCTDISIKQIESYARDMVAGMINPRDIKFILGTEIVTSFYGEHKAAAAYHAFRATFEKKEIPDNVPTCAFTPETQLVDVFLEQGIVVSKGEFRRLIEEGAITHLETESKIKEVTAVAMKGVYRIGKKRFLKIK